MVVIRVEFLALLAAVTQMVIAQKGAYDQCRFLSNSKKKEKKRVVWVRLLMMVLGGGIGYTGSTVCIAGYTCHSFSEWYSQCNPGAATPTLAPTPTSSPTLTLPPTQPSSTPPTLPSSAPPTQPSSAPPASCPSPSGTSLDAKIKAKGRDYFGTCTDRNTLSDPAYEAIVISEYGQVTPENSMKWESTESEFSPHPP